MDLSSFNNKKILITGGNGYIAYNLIKALGNNELTVARLDSRIDKWPGIEKNGKIIFQNIEADIRKRDVLESVLPGFDIIYHFAAQTSSSIADSDPVNDAGINLIPLINILDICEKKNLKTIIIFSGTATEIGLNKQLVVSETEEDLPVTIYDLNKLLAETYLNYYCRKGIVKGATLRLANVYGPGPLGSNKDRGIVNMMVKRGINNIPLTLYGDGEYIRDYIFIDDVIYAFLAAAQSIDKINGEHFYIGSGKGHSIAELFSIISERTFVRTGSRPAIRHEALPDNSSVIEKRNFISNISKFVSSTGWEPTIDLQEGLDLTIEYFLNQII